MNEQGKIVALLENGLKEHNDECILCAVKDTRIKSALALLKPCEYAKSDMTPCYLRDGKTALAGGICVGCSHSVQYLERDKEIEQYTCVKPVNSPMISGDSLKYCKEHKVLYLRTMPCPLCLQERIKELEALVDEYLRKE